MHPTAYADQFTAATQHAMRVLTDAITQGIGEQRHHDPWVHAQADALIRTLTAGITYPCSHIGPVPQLAQAAVWAPGRLACPACAPLWLTPDAVEETTCDQCRRPSRQLYAGMVNVGPVLLAYGRCHRCLKATLRHQPRRLATGQGSSTRGR